MQTNTVSTFKDQTFLAFKREYLKRIYLGTKAEREKYYGINRIKEKD